MGAREAREVKLVDFALRCYPARWRRRHGDEAAELAALLIADGRSAASIAWSYLVGAAREWLAPRPGRSLSTVAAALLAATCLLGLSAALVAESAPARAAGTTQSTKIKPALPSTGSGSPHRGTPCHPVLPGHVPAASHWPPSIQATAYVRSC
jgi:hypothetical protein